MPPALWFTSRTPIDCGQRRCAMARYLGYHAGPHGTGYRRVAQAIPLATGSGVHHGLELLGQWLMDWQERHGLVKIPEDQVVTEVVRWAASEAARKYETRARATGLIDLAEPAQAEIATHTILEQRTLIEAQVWVWAILQLPNLLAEYSVLGVESEEVIVLDCSCGLGGGVIDVAAHAARGCSGIVMQGRPDWLVQHRVTKIPRYIKFKTKSTPNIGWEKAWEHDTTLLVDMEAASRRLGKSVEDAVVHVLYKGARRRPWKADVSVPKRQESPLCYGYYQPAVPPMREAEWQAEYESLGEDGKVHRLPKTYEKQAIWDESIPLPTGPGQSRVEAWVRGFIQPSQWPALFNVLGPFSRVKESRRLNQGMLSIAAEETRWRYDVASIREDGVDPDAIIPRSWQCTEWDGSPCPFKGVCDGEVDLATSERFIIRTPHHAPEKVACEAAGVVFVAEDADEEGEGE